MISNEHFKLHNDNEKTIKSSNTDFNGSSFMSELLAPAGSKESFYAAINAGADAVYMGGSMFGARAFADNPDEDELLSLMDYAHLHNKKLFLTVNTLLKNSEIKVLYDYIKPYYKNGLDAVIVQDFGVLDFFKEYFPDLPVHISTQMTVTNTYLPSLLKQYDNVHRIVTARELSLEEIKAIYDETGLEIESFVHGALCYSYSGQCLFSSIVGGRSGNRGRCAQPCRLPYKSSDGGNYPLSPKDLMTLKILPDILNAGVYSLKIEGRMKKPEYVASVVSVYRYYLDMLKEKGLEGYKVSEKDVEKLMDIYNRGNFTEGYYANHNGSHMMSVDRPNHTGVCVLKQQNNNRFTALKPINEGDLIEIAEETFLVKNNIKTGQSVNLYDIILNKGKDNLSKLKSRQALPQYIFRTRNNKLIDEITDRYIKENIKVPVYGKVTAKLYDSLKFQLRYKDIEITVTGPDISMAQNKPVSETDLRDKFSKLGNTPFEYSRLDIFADENIFVSMKACNDLRREAFQKLNETILEAFRRNDTEDNGIKTSLDKISSVEYNQYNERMKDNHPKKITKLNVLISTDEQLKAVIELKDYVDIVYIDLNYYSFDNMKMCIDALKNNNLKSYIALPYIFRSKAEKLIDKYREVMEEADGYLLRTLEEYGYLESKAFKNRHNVVFDYTIYDYNKLADEFLERLKPQLKTLSLELDFHELKDFDVDNSELMVYGQFPLMISAQCVNKTYNKCLTIDDCQDRYGEKPIKSQKIFDKGLNNHTLLTDRLNNQFKSVPICRYCYSLVYNNKPLSLLNVRDKVQIINPSAVRLNFIFEDEGETKQIIYDFIDVYQKDKAVECTSFLSNNYTKGHFLRKTD